MPYLVCLIAVSTIAGLVWCAYQLGKAQAPVRYRDAGRFISQQKLAYRQVHDQLRQKYGRQG